ncbi:DMT family transporter [Fulvivirga lutea]|uniref:DMT family transporter n=2 Tax=Fulvivirga lutea TaxID=2810512 RepID=A0A974WIZ7_9BACT|nr:DMT family transporter [Fulvivirga lutea]
MLLATFFFSLMNVFVKMVPDIPAVEIVFFRSVVSLFLSFFFLRIQSVNIWGNNKKVLLFRGVSGAVALILYFTTLQLIPLASAVTIQFLSPIFSSILGIYIVKEKVKPWQWIFYLLAFSGVILVKGFDPRITPELFAIGIVSAFFSGLAYNFIRKLKQTEHPLVIVFYFPLVTLPVTGIISAFDWYMPHGDEWFILLLVGVFTQLAQYFMTKAYQAEELSKIASLKYLGLIYALGFGYVFFEETFNLITYFGMTIMIVGVILNVWYKNNLTNAEIKKAIR